MKIGLKPTQFLALVFTVILGTSNVMAQDPDPVFIAATWSDNSVHFLDGNMGDISSFAAGALSPNGLATNGTLIFSGHFSSEEVVAYDFSGVEQFRWSAALSGLQGMEMFGTELVIWISGRDELQFRDAATGTLNRTLFLDVDNVEGVAFDGTQLWLLGISGILSVDPNTGNVNRTISNAASGCSFGGTGITVSAPGQLHLGCTDGSWYQVSMDDGAVLDSGNNGLDMYGLKLAAGSPAPSGLEPVPAFGPAGVTLLILLFAGLGWSVLGRRYA